MEGNKDKAIKIEDLYNEDVKERWAMDWKDKDKIEKLREKDKIRRQKAKELLDSGTLSTGLDYHHASLIFQHGETTDDFRLAHELAEKAVNLGDETAKWLYAATQDRWLLSQGKPQKFGTQFKDENGEITMPPVDPSMTDEERAKWGVPPLAQAIQHYKEKYGIK